MVHPAEALRTARFTKFSKLRKSFFLRRMRIASWSPVYARHRTCRAHHFGRSPPMVESGGRVLRSYACRPYTLRPVSTSAPTANTGSLHNLRLYGNKGGYLSAGGAMHCVSLKGRNSNRRPHSLLIPTTPLYSGWSTLSSPAA
jgi:hypothetical protein